VTESRESKDKKLRDAIALLMIIADSEKARREARWLTQEQMEDLLRQMWREL